MDAVSEGSSYEAKGMSENTITSEALIASQNALHIPFFRRLKQLQSSG